MYNPREHRNYKFRIYPTKTQAETIPNLATVSEPASKEEKLALSKIGLVKIKLHREIPGKVKTCIIKRETTGKWYAVLSVEECPVLYSPNWKKPVWMLG